MIRVAVTGARGGLGAAACRGIAAASDMSLVAEIGRDGPDLASVLADGVDVLFEATLPDSAEHHIRIAIDSGVPVVVGTTAWDKRSVDAYARERGVPVSYAANFATGGTLMFEVAEVAAARMPLVEVIETHPPTKKDAPSGTALTAARRVAAVTGTEPPIHSVRVPGVMSRHEIVFGAPGESLRIIHEAVSNDAFTPAILDAIRAVRSLPPGLTVT